MSWPQMNDGGGSGAVGFFGKIPAIGDFVHRRLPDDFLSAWDHWLQHMVVSSREAMGDGWLERYVVAPFWRFIVVPGVVGRTGWMGVVMPSVDRVGRYFPFTLAMPLPGNVNFIETFIAAHNWFESLEDLGAVALHPQLDMADWDVRLAAMPMPPLVLAGMEDDATIPLFKGKRGPVVIPLPREDAAMALSLAGVLSGFRRPFSLFSAIANDREGRVVLATEGLPDNPRCHALLDGRWQANGWEYPGAAEAASAPIPNPPVAPAPVSAAPNPPVPASEVPPTPVPETPPAAASALVPAADPGASAPVGSQEAATAVTPGAETDGTMPLQSAQTDDTLPLPAELAASSANA